MSDDYQAGDVVSQMESDIAHTAAIGRRFAAVPGGFGSNVRALGTGASAVSQRMEAMLKTVSELATQADSLATQLTGPDGSTPDRAKRPGSRSEQADTVFSRQMAALDEIQVVLDTVARSLERAHRSLA